MKLGPLVDVALEKDFPDCWKTLADMLKLEYEHTEGSNEILIYAEDQEILISKDNVVTATSPLTKELATQILITTIKQNKGKPT